MKVKVIDSISKFFKMGDIVEMDVINEQGDFRLTSKSFSQAFDKSFHVKLMPVSFKEFAEEIITKIENELYEKEKQ